MSSIEKLALCLKKNKIPHITDMEKITTDKIIPMERLDRSYIIYPKFLRDKCVGCQRCYISCMDGGHQAISIVDDRPVLDPKKCVGCHLCTLVCPQNAIVSSGVKVPKKR